MDDYLQLVTVRSVGRCDVCNSGGFCNTSFIGVGEAGLQGIPRVYCFDAHDACFHGDYVQPHSVEYNGTCRLPGI